MTSDTHDFERTAATINFGDCRLGPCVNGGGRTEVELVKCTVGGRTDRGVGWGCVGHRGAGEDH